MTLRVASYTAAATVTFWGASTVVTCGAGFTSEPSQIRCWITNEEPASSHALDPWTSIVELGCETEIWNVVGVIVLEPTASVKLNATKYCSAEPNASWRSPSKMIGGVEKAPDPFIGTTTGWAPPPSRLKETSASRLTAVAPHVLAVETVTEDPES